MHHLATTTRRALCVLAVVLTAGSAGCSSCTRSGNGPIGSDARDGDAAGLRDTEQFDIGDAARDTRSRSDSGVADDAETDDNRGGGDARDASPDATPPRDVSTVDGTSDARGTDVQPRDGSADVRDGSTDARDGSAGDSARADGGADAVSVDGADGHSRDTAPTADTSGRDGGRTDAGSPPSGLSTRCSNGPGWTLFEFHYPPRGSSPRIDVWDAACGYSNQPNSACRVMAVRNPGFTSGRRGPRAILLTRSKYLQVRFSVRGLQFSKADVHVQARSYSTTRPTRFRVWSP
ncbi:MAG: hypothetical protein ABEL76_08975, partial [Bradymonadaceae bacterium]